MLLWLQLLLCLAVIGYAGYFLSRYGDIIAEKTGMSASWVGLILLSTATSLPELVTGISAVTFANAPNIVAMRAVYSYERHTLSEYTEVSAERYSDVMLGSAVKGYALADAQGEVMRRHKQTTYLRAGATFGSGNAAWLY
jgi:cation:H+ antiporter